MDTSELPSVREMMPMLTELGIQYGVRILAALGILVAVWFVSAAVANGVASVLRKTHADGTVTSFTRSVVRWSLIVLGVLVCMSIFGVEMTSIAALIGGAGVALGVALNGNRSNLASGLVLLAFRPFEEGEWVEVSDKEGLVSRIGLFHVELDAFDNARHWIPNADVIEQVLTNYEAHPFRRADLVVGVAYDTDLDLVVEVLQRVGDEWSVEGAPRPAVVLALGFGNSSIDFKVGAWCHSKDYWGFRSKLILAVKRAFDEADITIPFPQRDLHLIGPLPTVPADVHEVRAAN